MVKKCRSCGKNRLIEFFFKQFMGKRGHGCPLTAACWTVIPKVRGFRRLRRPGSIVRALRAERWVLPTERAGSAERNYKTHRREAAISPPFEPACQRQAEPSEPSEPGPRSGPMGDTTPFEPFEPSEPFEPEPQNGSNGDTTPFEPFFKETSP